MAAVLENKMKAEFEKLFNEFLNSKSDVLSEFNILYLTIARKAYNCGEAKGRKTGLLEGREQGFSEGRTEGHLEGHAEGFEEGFSRGLERNYKSRLRAFSAGYAAGYFDGCIAAKKYFNKEDDRDQDYLIFSLQLDEEEGRLIFYLQNPETERPEEEKEER